MGSKRGTTAIAAVHNPAAASSAAPHLVTNFMQTFWRLMKSAPRRGGYGVTSSPVPPAGRNRARGFKPCQRECCSRSRPLAAQSASGSRASWRSSASLAALASSRPTQASRPSRLAW